MRSTFGSRACRMWAVLVLTAAGGAHGAQTWYVAASGSDNNGGSGWGDAFQTISNGVGHAQAGDTVLVSNGLYTLSAQINITNGVSVQGFNGDRGAIVNGNGAVRCFSLSDAGAVVDGLTISNGYQNATAGGGVTMTAGALRNCTVVQNRGEGSGGGVYMAGGTVTNCTIWNNRVDSWHCHGGGIDMTGGLVIDSTISSNSVGYAGHTEGSGGIHLQNGTVENCLIVGNVAKGGGSAPYGGGGVRIEAGVLRKCRILNNQALTSTTTQYGGGVVVAGGVVENCLIANNISATWVGGGVYMSAGAVRHCTIVSNSAPAQDGGGLYLAGGTVSNTVAYLNSGLNAASRNVYKTAGTFAYSCTTPLIAGGSDVGNAAADPDFRDVVSSDYRLAPGFPCIDTASNIAAVVTDIEGAPRPVDGNGDGVAQSDMGAYEDNPAAGPLRCNFLASTNTGMGVVTVTLTAYVAGANTNGLVYYWDFQNDGTVETNGAVQQVVTNTYGAGTYSVRLTVTNAAAEGASRLKANLITVASDNDVYVSPSGTGTFPYDTWANAATNIQTAIDKVQAALDAGGTNHTVWVTNATYNLGAELVISRNVTVVCPWGPTGTLVNGGAAVRCLSVNSTGAVVQGLTFTNGQGSTVASGVYLTGGLLTNCAIVNCRNLRALYVTGGAVQNCEIRNNTAGTGGGVYMNNGTVNNCTIAGNASADGSSGSGVQMAGGTLSGSRIWNNSGSSYGHGIYLSAGLVSNCDVRANVSSAWGTDGGGIYVAGGTVQQCTIVSNVPNGGQHTYGAGLRLDAGVVEDCTIFGNTMAQAAPQFGNWGGGAYVAGGTLRRCLLYANVATGNDSADRLGGGIYMTGGLVQNCVLRGNMARHSGGGIYLAGGRVENCTIVSNTASFKTGGGLYEGGGAVTNAIVYFNTAATGGDNVQKAGGVFAYSCSMPLIAGGSDIANTAGDPQFQNQATNDFRLVAGSPCIDTGTNIPGLTTDIIGTLRPIDGNGDGTNIVDMGAYEFDPSAGPLQCNFSANTNTGLNALTVVFTASFSGNTNGLTCHWDFQNDGTYETNGPGLQVVTNTYGPGIYSVLLTVSNAAAAGASQLKANLITVGNDADAYVATNGSHTFPYDTWARAATNIQAAIDKMESALGAGGTSRTVWIGDGRYVLGATLAIGCDLTLKSTNGPAGVSIDGNAAVRCLTINSTGAWVDGLTFTNGQGTVTASGIYMAGSTLTNCVVSGCRNYWGVYMASGALWNCSIVNNTAGSGGGLALAAGVVRNCTVRGNIGNANGGGAYVTGGELTGCTVANNRSVGSGGCGVYMTAGLVSNCVIQANYGIDWSHGGGGVYVGGGLLTHSTIVSNYVSAGGHNWGGGLNMGGGVAQNCQIIRNYACGGQSMNGGGAYLGGGVLRNSLVTGNETRPQSTITGYGGGVFLNGGRLENCTLVRNATHLLYSSSGGGAYISAGTMTNAIVYFNNATAATNVNTAAGVGNSCAPELAAGVNGNWTADPAFKNAGSGYGNGCTNGDYRLAGGSPCVDSGTNLTWMTNAIDLAGAKRIIRGIVDLGAYENDTRRGTLFSTR